MAKQLTRIILIIQFIAAALVSFAINHWVRQPWDVAVPVGLAGVLFVRLTISANNFLMALRYRGETLIDFRLTRLQTFRMLAFEFCASMWNTSWAMPFKTFRLRKPCVSRGLPVLLIHGYVCNSGYWHHLSKVLMHSNIQHLAVDLEPLFADIDSYVSAIHAAVNDLCEISGQERIVVVAHSMGGLAVRAYLRDHGPAQIAKIITLATPHHGTKIAHFGLGVNGRQMRWQGDPQISAPNTWLDLLNSGESAQSRSRIVSIFSYHDNIVVPQTSAILEGARNLAFHGIGHVAMALHPLIQKHLLKEIQQT